MRERKRQRLQVAVYKPMCRAPAPELIDLTLSDSDDETVILPPVPPVFEVLDTSRAIRVRRHEDIPLEVLISFVREHNRYITESIVSCIVADWCIFRFKTRS